MLRPLLLGFLLFLVQLAAHGTDARTRDVDLSALVASIPSGSPDRGMRKKEQALADRFHSYGPEAIPYLLPLLESKEEHIRLFAGYVLRDQRGLTEKHLPALIAAYQGGSDWLPPAIGRIGTPTAVQFLIADLKARPQSSTQVTYAIELAGERAISDLVALLDTPVAVNEELPRAVCEILSALKNERSANLLLKIASDRKVESSNRLHAVESIGCVRNSARRVIPGLRALAAAEPVEFRKAVNETIMRIGSPHSVPYFVEALRSDPNMGTFGNLAALREDAIAAGPALVELLLKPDPDTRVGAARALGHIGYKPAADHLLPLLADGDDWRLAFVAAESLGRLQAQQAIPALDTLASNHWYPRVRYAARFATKVIRGEAAHPSSPVNSPMDFFEFKNPDEVSVGVSRSNPPLPFVNAPESLTGAALEKLEGGGQSLARHQGGKATRPATRGPTSGLKVADGYIVGRDYGEFGGELAYVTEQSAATILLKENTSGIYRMPFGILAVTGLAHLQLNYGALFLVSPSQDGGYQTKRWKTLPGAPGVSGMLANGNLFISTIGGAVVITPEGSIEMAPTSYATSKSEKP